MLEQRHQPVVLESDPGPTGLRWSPASWACLLDDEVHGWIAGIIIRKTKCLTSPRPLIRLFDGSNERVIFEL